MINSVKYNSLVKYQLRFICLIPLLLAISTTSSFAEPPAAKHGQGQASQEQIQAFGKAQSKMQNLQQQLSQIQKKAIQSNPKLAKQEQEFRDLLLKTMKKEGHDPEADFEQLKKLQAKIQDKNTPEADREKMINELQQKNTAFQQMQQKIMQNKSISTAQASLNKNTFDAMKKADPNTDKLLQELQQTQQEMIQIRQAAMSGMR